MKVIATLRHCGSVGLWHAKLAVQRQLEYPMFLVSWLMMNPIQYLCGVWMLQILVNRFQPLAGWTFPQIAFVYGLGLLSHGVMVTLFIQTWFIGDMVVHGRFDRFFLRPVNVFFQFITQYINFIGLTDLIPGTIIFAYACKETNFSWSLYNIIMLIIVILSGTGIRAAFYIATSSIAFWTKRSDSMIEIMLVFMERGTMYPLTIYPMLIQFLLTFIFPIGFIAFYPSCEFLTKDSGFLMPLELAIWAPIVAIVLLFVALAIFQAGLRRYESTGS